MSNENEALLDAIAERVAERLRGPAPSAIEAAVERGDWSAYLKAVEARAIAEAQGDA